MAAKPYSQFNQINSKLKQQRTVPKAEVLVREARRVESLLKEIAQFKLRLKDYPTEQIERYAAIKNLISFSKQVMTQMMRSNDRYRGFKVDTRNYAPSSKILFLAGTLCEDFGYMNTSPLYGYNILDIGCGALSPYIEIEFPYLQPKKEEDLLVQFHQDYPPLCAEILQILGAKVNGLDPRPNYKNEYEYQTAYKHRMLEYPQIKDWLTSVEIKFDVISCLSLFGKYDFSFYYSTPDQLVRFLSPLRHVLSPQGLLYSDPPLLPTQPDAREMNRRIFGKAGFRVVYEGYYYILEVFR